MNIKKTLLIQKKNALATISPMIIIPLYVSIPLDFDTSLGVFAKLDPDFLLESAESAAQVGRYSFMGKDYLLKYTIQSYNNPPHTLTIEHFGHTIGAQSEIRPSANPVQDMFSHFEAYKTSQDQIYSLPSFWGGLVGYMGFECVRFFEPLNLDANKPKLDVPDAVFFLPKMYYIVDHLTRKLWFVGLLSAIHSPDAQQLADDADVIIAHIEDSINTLQSSHIDTTDIQVASKPFASSLAIHSNQNSHKTANSDSVDTKAYQNSVLAKASYQKIVSDGIDLLKRGNMIQVVLARDKVIPLAPEKEFEVYMSLRSLNPSPYMYYIKFDGFAIIGASPETMLTLQSDGEMIVRPIAGTIRRGQTKAQDKANITQLVQDPKERAEHLMLIDLARNDLNRVADTDSVHVTRYFDVETFSHVHHIVSEVRGQKRKDLRSYDVIASCFPAGTLSGAPKIEAIQHIFDTEPTQRKVYGGLVGIYGFDGYFDACICIRTMVIKDGQAYLKAGAGIVVDSKPANEWTETELKLSALVKSLEELS